MNCVLNLLLLMKLVPHCTQNYKTNKITVIQSICETSDSILYFGHPTGSGNKFTVAIVLV